MQPRTAGCTGFVVIMAQFTFKKEERLTNKKKIDALFESGKSANTPSFKLVWDETTDSNYPVQVLISVPKKIFSSAVTRNRIKRRIREAYRKNKHSLYEILSNKHLSITLALIYIAKEELPYSDIEKKLLVSLQKLTNNYK